MTTTPPPMPEALRLAECLHGTRTAEVLRTQHERITTLESELRPWKSVFGHLGTADECGNEWVALKDALERKDGLLRQALEQLEYASAGYEVRVAVEKELQ